MQKTLNIIIKQVLMKKMDKIGFKVYDNQKGITHYTPYECYKMVVDYPGTGRQLEFIGMDRGSCIMQAEVMREESDTVILTASEELITLYQKEKINE
jgi:hypothetical protein